MDITLGELIDWLDSQPADKIISNGFASPHSDRGDYSELAFSPAKDVTVESMLNYARSAIGKAFVGWKGGSYFMDEYTPVHIGEYGECGEDITTETLYKWEHGDPQDQIDALRAEVKRLTEELAKTKERHAQNTERWRGLANGLHDERDRYHQMLDECAFERDELRTKLAAAEDKLSRYAELERAVKKIVDDRWFEKECWGYHGSLKAALAAIKEEDKVIESEPPTFESFGSI